MNVLCKTIYMSQEDNGLHVLHDGDSLPISPWKNEDTPGEQFKEYINLDPQWATIELVDTETKNDIISIIFVCILPPQTEILKGEWKPFTREDFHDVNNSIIFKAMQKIQ